MSKVDLPMFIMKRITFFLLFALKSGAVFSATELAGSASPQYLTGNDYHIASDVSIFPSITGNALTLSNSSQVHLVNDGSVRAGSLATSQSAVFSYSPLSLFNNYSGNITGYSDGVTFTSGNNYIQNLGDITAEVSQAVVWANQASGIMDNYGTLNGRQSLTQASGSSDGIEVDTTGAVTINNHSSGVINSALKTKSYSRGILLSRGTLTVINDGLIEASMAAVQAIKTDGNRQLSVFNNGIMKSQSGFSLLAAEGFSILNRGIIVSDIRAGIKVIANASSNSGTSIFNDAEGIITGQTSAIDSESQASSSVFNKGIISSLSDYALKTAQNMDIVNEGVITSGVSAIYAGSANHIINNGAIKSHYGSVVLNNNNTLINNQTIAAAHAAGILLEGDNNIVTLGDHSLLETPEGPAILNGGEGNVLNLEGYGQLAGDIAAILPDHGLSRLASSYDSDWTLSGDTTLSGQAPNVLEVKGKLTLLGDNVITGGGSATIDGGILQLGDGHETGNISAAIHFANAGQLAVNRSDVVTLSQLISGEGAVIQNGSGTTILSGNNTYSGGTVVNSGTLAVSDDSALGQPGSSLMLNGGKLQALDSILLSGNRTLSVTTQGGVIDTMGNHVVSDSVVSGQGRLLKTGEGILTLNSVHNDINTIDVLDGILDVNGSSSGAINMMQGTILTGIGSVGHTTLQTGSELIVGHLSGSPVDKEQFTINGDLLNQGRVLLNRHTSAGNQLNVAGNYYGEPGKANIIFNGELGDDNSPVDMVRIGGNATGVTDVSVHNVGGIGADTLNGLEIIDVKGRSNDGAFVQNGRIVAGSYDYFLHKGSKNGDKQSWFLSTSQTEQDNGTGENTDNGAGENTGNGVGEITDNGAGENTGNGVGENTDNGAAENSGNGTNRDSHNKPETDKQTDSEQQSVIPNNAGKNSSYKAVRAVKIVRPEAGAYIANANAAKNMFMLTLEDRQGRQTYRDVEGNLKPTTMWLRQTATKSKFDAGQQLNIKSNQYVAQAGADIARFYTGEKSALHIGVMAGYGTEHSTSRSAKTQYKAKGEVKGYSGGVSATWFADDESKLGLYSDNWLQYGKFKNTVRGDELAPENYRSQGITASTEVGYNFRLQTDDKNALLIQPQLQVVRSDVKAKSHKEANGTKVTSPDAASYTTRAGIRTTYETENYQPYVEVNWIHNIQETAVNMNGVSTEMSGAKNIADIKGGLRTRLSDNVEVVAEVSVQKGTNNFSNIGGAVDLRYSF